MVEEQGRGDNVSASNFECLPKPEQETEEKSEGQTQEKEMQDRSIQCRGGNADEVASEKLKAVIKECGILFEKLEEYVSPRIIQKFKGDCLRI